MQCRRNFRCQHLIGPTLILRLITTVPSSSTTAVNFDPALLKSYTVTPPIKPWPQRLYPKRLVSMITRQQNLDLSLQIFEYAGKYHPGFSHNYDTYHAIIQRLSRMRAFEPVEALLSQLQSSEIKCGENLFITVIRNYGLASRPKSAVKTFLRIESFGVQRSVRSLNTLLNALVQNKRYDLVHLLFRNCKTKFGVVPNVFTCNILVKALSKKNDVEGAIRLLDEMPSMGMIPNVVTYTTILGGYVSRGDMIGAKRVFGEILDRGWLPDATTYTILMDGFCKQGRLIDAIKVMDDMEENGVEPNDVTYGVMIEAYVKEKKSGEALNLLDDMLDKKYIPGSALCCRVIDLLCHEGKVEDACELWKMLLKKNCTPDNAISSTLTHWLCKMGKIWEARKMFDEFERGSIPSLLTYNTLIAGMCEKGELCEAGRLWDDMVEKGCHPNAFTYNMLIKGFCTVGKAKEGIRFLDEMLEKGCLPNKSTYSILIEGLSDSGMAGEVTKVIEMAMSKGVDSDTWTLFLKKAISNLDTGLDDLDRIILDNVT
ncbi:putative Pentatricopeptide repeat-containing protein [Quillaja saponaria]|uniref:Pentatricopeptide repeat-containing protein n=1 Tax=Quillaja saponaria TaxID=32244 RepID=A0AAD7PQI7_QUISA|nr:putative Pentatricopeptide repeat-containing protein [Quillaja saponaria]KAJ7963464.1 putative Pentatricopeptide repeat-containing protein [Quillaja saponaria]